MKEVGDAMVLEFDQARSAALTAYSIQTRMSELNEAFPQHRKIFLRMGIEVDDVIVSNHDVYGRGVNLAARLKDLASPGEIVVSASARAQLTAALDADIEDLGDCYLKHIQKPVRAFRIGPPSTHTPNQPENLPDDLYPLLAVIPFSARDVGPEHVVLGEILAEEIIAHLSQTPDMRVISRMSTTTLRGRDDALDIISSRLNAQYLLNGSYRIDNNRLVLRGELLEVKSGEVIWATQSKAEILELFTDTGTFIDQIVMEIGTAVVSHALTKARSQKLPTLNSYTLLLASIALMHRLSRRDFEDAYKLLQTLIERASRQSIPHAWMAKWHVLRVQQGWSEDPEQDGRIALEYTRRALDADPDSSLALAIDGFVHTNLLKMFDVAQDRYDHALTTNPNNSLAWLLKGTWHAFKGEGKPAVLHARQALRLSPFDPDRYFYDSLAATAYLADQNYEQALQLAVRSLRANKTHTSTLRAKGIAQWQLGHHEAARKTGRELMRLEPALTIERWRRRSPSSMFSIGKEWAEILHNIGVPSTSL